MTRSPSLRSKVLKPVSSLPELQETIATLQRISPESLFLYRGQTHLYGRVQSSKSRNPQVVNREVQAGWRALACAVLGISYAEGSVRRAEAILQHYGAPTHYVDLTHDFRIAAWFALHQAKRDFQLFVGTCMREIPYICYERIKSDFGYILVFAFPDAAELENSDLLFSLETLPKDFVRPARQKGWLMFDQPPIVPIPNDYWICSIPVVTKSFKTDLSPDYLFPGPDQDPAFKAFATLPYVQIPFAYFPSATKESVSAEKCSHNTYCFASRALDLPEYLKSPTDEAVNHKWEDFTIFEPDPMRMWRNWRSELDSQYAGLTGNIASATKITIAPMAFTLLGTEASSNCSWPSVDSNDILFTFAGLDHDKAVEHGPPYRGVWLHREGDLILEVPIESDHNIMSTTPGHGYMFRGGQLVRVPIAPCCPCGNPESHDQRVFSVLQISKLVREGKLIFLPHPRLSGLGWFLVLSPHESSHIQPAVDSFHRVLRAVLGKVDGKTNEMDTDESTKLQAIKSGSEKAFNKAKLISSDDDRWHLVVSQIKQTMAPHMLADELGSAVVERQVVIYIPERLSLHDGLPEGSILYLWPTVFGPIVTFSFFRRCGEKVESFRTYWKPSDARINCAKNEPTLVAYVNQDNSSITRLVEADLRPVTNLVAQNPGEVLYVDDFEAARLLTMDNLNKPTAESRPEHWLRHGFITRLAQELDEAIRCIVENELDETIHNEAHRLKAQGLGDCYKAFPCHQDVYAFCESQLANEHDHLLRPFIEVNDASTKADAQTLGYQLQQIMICALYSVNLTRGGTCIPSYDSRGQLDIVELDPNLLGQKAKSFWQNLPWTIIHLYRETIGAAGFPADICGFYEQVPVWQGGIKEGQALAKKLLAEAVATKLEILPERLFFSIEQGGILAAVRLREFGDEVLATFYDPLGGFIQGSINPKGSNWKLNMHTPASVYSEFHKSLEQTGVFEGLFDADRERVYHERFNLWIRQIEVGIGVFLATLLRDFCAGDGRKSASPQKSMRKVKTSAPKLLTFPRIRYPTKVYDHKSDQASQKRTE